MTIKKTTRKTTRIAKKLVYKVIAAYSGKFRTLSDAKAAFATLKANPKAQLTPIKKSASGYTFVVKFAFIAASAQQRDAAVNGAKSQGAKVTVSTVRI